MSAVPTRSVTGREREEASLAIVRLGGHHLVWPPEPRLTSYEPRRVIHRTRFVPYTAGSNGQTFGMHLRPAFPEPLNGLADRQAGIVTWEQALQLGMPAKTVRKLVTDGYWTRLSSGIYLTHAMRPAWSSLAWAGALVGGPEAASTGKAALRLDSIIAEEELPIHFLLPFSASYRPPNSWWRFSRTRTPFRAMGELPRVPIERVIIDLCATEPGRALHWVMLAVGSRKTTASRLREQLDEISRHPIRAELKEILADAEQGVHSPLEYAYLRNVERAHGLSGGRRQVRSRGYFRDVYYDEGLIVELDGRLGHDGVDAFRDMDRDNYHTARGKTTLRFGWHQCVNAPCRAAAMVADLRHQLGWTDEEHSCRRCLRRP